MRLVSILLILAAPLLEIGLLIKVGQVLGFWWTMAIIVGTGLLGIAVLMENGLAATGKIQEAMLRGEAPVGPMFDSALRAVAGVLLITPGLIADAIGAVLLIPPLRGLLARLIARKFFGGVSVDIRTSRTTSSSGRPFPGDFERPRPRGTGPVIETEFKRIEEDTVDPPRRKPDPRDQG